MTREFKLPDIGEGLTEAEIVAWLVEPGDRVSEDQPVAEVETDKAIVEIPSPVNGAVKEILAEEGEVVPVGTVIITFDSDDAADSDADESGEATTTSGGESSGETVSPDDDTSSTGGRVFASPSTRRVARELGVELGSVEGSGPGGRITEADVRTAATESGEGVAEPSGEADEAAPAAETADGEAELTDDAPKSATRRVDDGDSADTVPAVSQAASERRDRTLAAPSTRKLAAEKGIDLDSVPTDRTKGGEAFVTPAEIEAYAESQQCAQEADSTAVSGGSAATGTKADERIPYRGVRQTIGEQMERSKYTAPHVTHHDEVDVTELVEVRTRLKEHAEERGVSLSYLPFVIKAVVAGLREFPILNSRLDEENEEIVLRGEYNVGIATATDAGLMVPVLKNADGMGLLELAEELNELTEKARDRSITREEMQGGTFSITNFGAIGGEYATPIINYPETAILGLGAIKEKPRVIDGEVVPRNVMTLSLSIDHRVIDGAEAARFINTVREYLESPELLLLLE